MLTADLRAAFCWSCASCGRENVERLPERTLDPAVADDAEELRGRIGMDLESVWHRIRMDGKVLSRKDAEILVAAARAGRGLSEDRYRRQYIPLTVDCRQCKMTFQSRWGKIVMGDLSDLGAIDQLDDDDDESEFQSV